MQETTAAATEGPGSRAAGQSRRAAPKGPEECDQQAARGGQGQARSDADQDSGGPATRTELERRKHKDRAHQRAGRVARRRAGRRAEPEPDSHSRPAPRAGSAEGVRRAVLVRSGAVA